MDQEKETSRLDDVLSTVSLSGLLSGARSYARTWGQVIRDRHRFAAARLAPPAAAQLRPAMAVYLIGVFLTFVIFLTVLRLNGLQVTKLYFLFQCLYFQILYTFLIHLAARLARGSGTLGDTAAISFYFFGIYFPVAMLLFAPILFYFPVLSLVAPDDSALSPPIYERFARNVEWLWIYLTFAVVPMALLMCIVLWLPWLCSVHGIRMRWFVLAILGVYTPAILLHDHFIARYADHALHVISNFLRRFFDETSGERLTMRCSRRRGSPSLFQGLSCPARLSFSVGR